MSVPVVARHVLLKKISTSAVHCGAADCGPCMQGRPSSATIYEMYGVLATELNRASHYSELKRLSNVRTYDTTYVLSFL
jgi:hypothetical protein